MTKVQNSKVIRWTGIHYYRPPKSGNRLLVIGILGFRFYWYIDDIGVGKRFSIDV